VGRDRLIIAALTLLTAGAPPAIYPDERVLDIDAPYVTVTSRNALKLRWISRADGCDHAQSAPRKARPCEHSGR